MKGNSGLLSGWEGVSFKFFCLHNAHDGQLLYNILNLLHLEVTNQTKFTLRNSIALSRQFIFRERSTIHNTSHPLIPIFICSKGANLELDFDCPSLIWSVHICSTVSWHWFLHNHNTCVFKCNLGEDKYTECVAWFPIIGLECVLHKGCTQTRTNAVTWHTICALAPLEGE
jgi:hypothetical protein